jgi:hypothetical protein
MTRQGYALARQASPRKWVTVFALLAFFLQGLVVQTHVHPSLAPATVQTATLQDQAPAPLKTQDPLDQCRLCQELVHAGSFFTPSAVTLAVNLSFITAIFATLWLPADGSATAFAWQSRAPPRR